MKVMRCPRIGGDVAGSGCTCTPDQYCKECYPDGTTPPKKEKPKPNAPQVPWQGGIPWR